MMCYKKSVVRENSFMWRERETFGHLCENDMVFFSAFQSLLYATFHLVTVLSFSKTIYRCGISTKFKNFYGCVARFWVERLIETD